MLTNIMVLRSAALRARHSSRTRRAAGRAPLCAAALLSAALGAPTTAFAQEPASGPGQRAAPTAVPGQTAGPAAAPSASPQPYPYYPYPPQYPLVQSYPYPAAPGAAYGQYPYHAGPGTPYGEYDVQYDDEGNPKKSKRPKVELPESVTKSPAYQAARDKKAGGIAMLSIGGAGVVGGAVWALTTSLNNAFTWGGGSPNNTGVTGGLVIMLTSGALMAGGGVVMAIGRKEQRRIENDYLNGAPPKLAVGLTPSGVMFGGTF